METSADAILDIPIEDVFRSCADVRNWDKWISTIQRVELHTTEPMELGSEFSLQQSLLGQSQVTRYQTTEFESPSFFTVTSRGGKFQYEGGMRMEKQDGGTLVTNWVRIVPNAKPGGILDKFAAMLESTIRQRIVQELEQLNVYLHKQAISAK